MYRFKIPNQNDINLKDKDSEKVAEGLPYLNKNHQTYKFILCVGRRGRKASQNLLNVHYVCFGLSFLSFCCCADYYTQAKQLLARR